jgi:hypothetical protein
MITDAETQFAERLRDELVPFLEFDRMQILFVIAKDGAREREIVAELVRTTTNLRKELAFALREDNFESCDELVLSLNAWKAAFRAARPMMAPMPGAGS